MSISVGSTSFESLYQRFCGVCLPGEDRSFKPFPWASAGDVGRIAVLRPGQLGDLLLAVPGLRALKRGFPAAEVDLIAQPWALDLSERLPYIDRVLPVQPLPHSWDTDGPGGSGALLREVGAGSYDLVLQLHADTVSSARFALALGGRATAGFCRDEVVGREFHLLLRMLEGEPEILRVLRLADALGAPPAGVHLEFPPLQRDVEEVEAVPGLEEALSDRPAVVVHPGARAPARRWPIDRFAKLASLIRERWSASLILVGGPEEAPLAREMLRMAGVPALDTTGQLSLGGLAALLGRVDLFVGNDSGPAQLAAAVASRSVRVFGPANRRRWAPLDQARHRIVYRPVECSPCGHWECPIDHRCLRWVSVEDVLAAVDSLLACCAGSQFADRRVDCQTAR